MKSLKASIKITLYSAAILTILWLWGTVLYKMFSEPSVAQESQLITPRAKPKGEKRFEGYIRAGNGHNMGSWENVRLLKSEPGYALIELDDGRQVHLSGDYIFTEQNQ